VNLPPLPPRAILDTHLPTGIKLHGFTAAQMSAYAAAAVAAERERWVDAVMMAARRGHGNAEAMPTPAMCRAAVIYANGPEIYSTGVAANVLEIEERIYAEVWRAMQAAAPSMKETQ